MEFEFFTQGLSEVAKSPLALVAYCLVIVGWFTIAIKESRFKTISKNLEQIPENQRLDAMKLEYGLEPRDGLSAESYLKLVKRRYLFIAFGITIFALLIIATLTIYRSIQIEKASVAQETMRIAYETFIRGTTSADDNRFKTSIGKIEESLKINPSYSGYVNLADIYDEIGDMDGALWASRKAAELDPNNPSPQIHIAMFLKDKGDLDQALVHAQKAMELLRNMAIKDDEFMVTLLVNTGNIYYEIADASSGSEQIRLAKIAKSEYF